MIATNQSDRSPEPGFIPGSVQVTGVVWVKAD